MTNFIILDIETNTDSRYNRTANFLYNDIVAYSIKDSQRQETHYTDSSLRSEYIEDLVTELCRHDLIVAHNAKFEMLYLWEYDKIQDWLRKGGKIYCTQLAEYYLSNYQTQFAALRELATTKYGCPVREKKMEEYWKQGIDTSDIPEDLVLEDVKNDVLDTYKIYIEQQKETDIRGKEFRRTIEIQNDLLLSTIEMEYNGFKVNKNTLVRNKTELQAELAQHEQDLKGLIERYWKV